MSELTDSLLDDLKKENAFKTSESVIPTPKKQEVEAPQAEVELTQWTPQKAQLLEDTMRFSGSLFGGAAGLVTSIPTTGGTGSPVMGLAGSALGNEGMGRLAQVINGIWEKTTTDRDIKFMPDTPESFAVDIMNKTLESTINMEVDGIFGTISSVIPGAVKKRLLQIRGSAAFNEAAQVATDQLAKYYKQMKVPFQSGALGNIATKFANSTLAKMPTSAGIIAESINKTMAAISDAFDSTLMKKLGMGSTPERAGEMLRTTYKSWKKINIENIGKAYKKVGSYFPKKANVKMDNTVAALKELYDDGSSLLDKKGKALVLPTPLKTILDNIESSPTSAGGRIIEKQSGELLWKDAVDLMTSLGDATYGSGTELAKVSKRLGNKIWAAMRQDLGVHAKKAGKVAFEAFESARAYQNAYSDKKSVLKSIANSATGTTAFTNASNLTKKSPEALRALKDMVESVDAKEGSKVWNDFVSSYLYQVSRAPATGNPMEQAFDFSANQFIKNWKTMQKTGTDKVLYAGNSGLRSSMDKLAKISASMKHLEKFSNTSNTAPTREFMDILSGRIILQGAVGAGIGGYFGTETEGEGGPGMVSGAAIGLITPYVFGKFMTSKTLVNWLAKGITIPKNNVNGIAAHIGRLTGIVTAEPELAGAVTEYLKAYNDYRQFKTTLGVGVGMSSPNLFKQLQQR